MRAQKPRLSQNIGTKGCAGESKVVFGYGRTVSSTLAGTHAHTHAGMHMSVHLPKSGR